MSLIENYKKLLRDIKENYITYPWRNVILDPNERPEDQEYINAIIWAINGGIINRDSCTIWAGNLKCVIQSYPFTLYGEDSLKPDNKKQLKSAIDEAVKSVGNQIGKWGIFGFVMLVLSVIFYCLNKYFSII